MQISLSDVVLNARRDRSRDLAEEGGRPRERRDGEGDGLAIRVEYERFLTALRVARKRPVGEPTSLRLVDNVDHPQRGPDRDEFRPEADNQSAVWSRDLAGRRDFEPGPLARPPGPLVRTVFRKATISTLPHSMRRMAGVRQSRLTDMLVLAFLRPLFKLVHRSPRTALKLVEMSSPSTVRVVGPALFGVEPADTSAAPTPAEARTRVGLRSPREQYAEQLAKRTAIPEAAPRDIESELLTFG